VEKWLWWSLKGLDFEHTFSGKVAGLKFVCAQGRDNSAKR